MASHLASGIIGRYDGYNDEFSRRFIFAFGAPFTCTGVKATYAFNSKITGMLVLVNGWDEFQRAFAPSTAAVSSSRSRRS